MYVRLSEIQLGKYNKAEIEDVLYRIKIGTGAYNWTQQPDEIEVSKRFTGGRGSSEVFELHGKWGNQEFLRVIKIGPYYDLKKEIRNFDSLKNQIGPSTLNAHFIPIEAATSELLEDSQRGMGRSQGIIYTHAQDWIAKEKLKTFRDIADSAIKNGDTDLENAIRLHEFLFNGIKEYFYKKFEFERATLHDFRNLRLGPDGVIEVEVFDPTRELLAMGSPSEEDLSKSRVLPAEITATETWKDGSVRPGVFVYLEDLKPEWSGNRLIVIMSSPKLMFEIVAVGNSNIQDVTKNLRKNELLNVYGKLKSIRAQTYKTRLLKELTELKAEDGLIKGPGATIPDLFVFLPKLLKTRPAIRVTSFSHGDLNPGNIIVIDDYLPCVIDYALTKTEKESEEDKLELLLSDFVRLEGCLAREILPKDLTWNQHVRLQRLLAASCRLGNVAIEKFTELLAQERKELASAFQLFYAIRKTSKDAYPGSERNQWYQDYLEQLFLFAYLMLKWEESQTPHALRAVAAMAGVASEAISGEDVYRWWSLEDLESDGQEIIKLLKNNPESSLSEMANIARGIDHWKKRERDHLLPKYSHIPDEYLRESAIETYLNATLSDSLILEFEGLRAEFVRRTFADKAREIKDSLRRDHNTYISLSAYINLKGKISAARSQKQLTFDEFLLDDSLLAEQERLSLLDEEGNDAINLIAEQPEVILIGDAGDGKTTVACEWEFRLAKSIAGEQGDTISSNMEKYTLQLPIRVLAPNLPDRLKNWSKENPQSIVDVISQDQYLPDLLAVGAVHLIVDSLNELDEKDKQKVVEWIISLRKAYSRTPVLVCHRKYTYTDGLLPFPVVTLQKVDEKQAEKYIRDYLRENKVIRHEIIADQLVTFLLKDPEQKHVKELAQTPLFLWMIVKYYQNTQKIPKSRGNLFKEFAQWHLERIDRDAHGEPVHYKYKFADKEVLLCVIGNKLVQKGTTSMPEKEVELIVPEEISEHWSEILKEVIVSEMLHRDNGRLSFMHHSFQEYFAACHFLKHAMKHAMNKDTIREKVLKHRWHDTFAILLGFAGEFPEVVNQIVKVALEEKEIGPKLTAHLLRMAENVDSKLLHQFVKNQEWILRHPRSGSFAHNRAAEALAEYGRDSAYETLVYLASDLNVPTDSRIEILRYLSKMPGDPRFESIKKEMEDKLEVMLEQAFNQPEDSKIYLACIDVIRTLKLTNLTDYLVDFIEGQKVEWPLRRAAWDACKEMRSRLIGRRKEYFTKACLERLKQAEAELFLQTSILGKMKELNKERCYLLRQIASPQNLPELLARRFGLEIHNEVKSIVEGVVESSVELPAGIEQAWQILKVQTPDETMIEEWLSLIWEGNSLIASAAAHQLVKMAKQGKRFPSHRLRNLLGPELKPDRLLLIAELIPVSGDKNVAESLDQFLRDFIKKTRTPEEFEALARLAFVLEELDSQRGKHLIAVAISFFYPSQEEIPYGRYPLLIMHHETFLGKEDFKILINRGEEDARAAIFWLETYGADNLVFAERGTITKLDKVSLEKIKELAESEDVLKWQCFFAIAATKVHAFELLPWLIKIVKKTPYSKDGTIDYYARSFEVFQESYLGMILRAIGYLARLLRDNNKDKEARPAEEFLHEYYHNLSENRKIVRGITTALGFLGEWKPILENLSPGELWMYESARNVFKYWVSPLKKYEYWKAACWILQYLKDHPELAPEVRSILEELKKHFDDELGHIITSPNDNFPLTPEEKKDI